MSHAMDALTLRALHMLEINPTLEHVPYQQTLGLIGTFESTSYTDLNQLHDEQVVAKLCAADLTEQLPLKF